MPWRSYLVLFAVSAVCLAINPGFRTEITERGLDYIREVGLPILTKDVQNFDIPDQSGEDDGFDWKLTDIRGSSLVIPNSSLTVVPGKGLKLSGTNVSLKVTAAWSYKLKIWPYFPFGSGTCDIPVGDTNMGLQVAVGADSEGHPTVTASNCSFDIGKIDVHFHGSDFDWLYNLFHSKIAGIIKDNIRGKVCPLAVNSINEEANKALRSLPVVEKVSSSAEINFELIKAPIFDVNYLQTLHKGEFLLVAHPIESPLEPPPLPPASPAFSMMVIWLTNYISNTAGYVYWQSGTLRTNVTADMVPKDVPFQLNTETFKDIVPALYAHYPNKSMQLFINATSPPAIYGSSNGLSLTATGDLTVYVVLDNKTLATAFTVEVTMHAKADVWLHQNGTKEILRGNATYLSADIKLVHSDIGQINVSKLNDSVNALIMLGVIPILNEYGEKGITIPTVDGVSFKNATLHVGDNYVVISTDFVYDKTVLNTVQGKRQEGSFVQVFDTGRKPVVARLNDL